MPRQYMFYPLLVTAGWLFFNIPSAISAPFRPTNDAQVIAQLPTRLLGAEQKTLRDLRTRLRAEPTNASLAAELAEHYYRLAQRTGDPRYIGYAQSALVPWPTGSDAPPAIRTVRALIAQFLHDFDAALKDLDVVLLADPGDVGARSYRAIIHLVKADYDLASADCNELERWIKGLVASACAPTVAAITGRAEPSLNLLSRLLSTYPAAPLNERLWVFNRLAEINQRLGRIPEADLNYKKALALGITDQYLLATYAEFLFDQNRPAEIIELLKSQTQNDVLLLRLALAEKSLGHPDTAKHQAMLADRYEASRQRGDKLHLADEAMFALYFSANPPAALKLAQENWNLMQREPSDARIFLEAALAAKDGKAAQPVLDWLRNTGHEDVKIRRLANQIETLGGDKK